MALTEASRSEGAMQAQALKSMFEAVIRESVTEPLTGCGFTQANRLYTRQTENLTHAVEVQLSKRNDERRRAFTINIGVMADGWGELVHPELIEKDPGLAHFPHMGPVHTRLGRLAGRTEDLWWTIWRPRKLGLGAIFGRKEHSADVAGEVSELLGTYGLPWLDQFRSVDDLIAWLEAGQEAGEALLGPGSTYARLWTLGVLCHLGGKPDAAREYFDQAVALAESGDWTAPGEPGATARELRKRILGV